MATTQYDDLIPLGRSLPVRVYLRSLWERRQFAISVPLGELRSKHMNTVLGNVWHLLNPILQVGVYYLVFDLLLNTSRGVENFLPYLAIGVFSFGYMQRSITACASSITNNQGLIRSLSFPRALLPISAVVRETIAFGPALVLMLVLNALPPEGIKLSWLLVIPWTLLMAMFSLGAGFVLARMTDGVQDVSNLLPFLFRISFYLSGILYAFEEVLPAKYAGWLPIIALNPFYAFISHMRHALMTTYQVDQAIDPLLWLSGLLYPVAFLVFGFLFFRAAEQRYGRG
ncbi:MAG TPA: ABC transporter permease [Euzebyales bacterium]|nr:ABC transporter permease [Euzebyales bacterium]